MNTDEILMDADEVYVSAEVMHGITDNIHAYAEGIHVFAEGMRLTADPVFVVADGPFCLSGREFMTSRKQSVDRETSRAALMIENSLSIPEIRSAVGLYGYSSEKLEEGRSLLREAEALSIAYLAAKGEMAASVDDFKKAFDAASKLHIKALLVARAAFGDNAKARKGLQLDGPRKRDFAGWSLQAETFYSNLLSDAELFSVMETYGWTRERLSSEFGSVKQVSAMKNAQRSSTGKARKALEVRDAAFDRLMSWISAYRVVVRVAMEASPQMMEALGIVVKS